jgi:MFS family permease
MNAPAPSKNRPVRVAGIRRGCVTWYSYLTLGFFTYLLNIQGNILPFLKAELDLSYRAVSLHSSALAAGLIAVGLFGDRVIRRYGRRRALRLGAAGISAGAVLLCLAPVAWASIGSCALMGRWGA